MDLEGMLKILLTSDGKGRKIKGKILTELCETQNPNYVREAISNFLKNNK